MSYVEVFKVEANGDVVSYNTAPNNHAGAPVVWEDLAKRHGFSNSPYVMADIDGLERMWKSIGTGKLERWEELVLVCTFDHIWVPRELVVEASEAIDRFYHERGRRENWKGEITRIDYTLGTVARLMKEIVEKDPSAAGVAFNMCSANSSYWYVHDSQEEWDEGVSDPRPYNVLTDKEQLCGPYKGKTAESIADILAQGTADA